MKFVSVNFNNVKHELVNICYPLQNVKVIWLKFSTMFAIVWKDMDVIDGIDVFQKYNALVMFPASV